MAKHSLNGLKRLLACMLILLMLTTGITSAGAVTVSADPTPTVVNTVDELENALSKGGDIKLGKSITYTETLSAEKNVSIDLAGYDLKYNNVYTAMEVKSAEVIFCDSSETHTGSFSAVLECDNLISYDASGLKTESLTENDYPISKLIFNGGIFKGTFGDSLINADFGGETIVINGGTFSNTKDDVFRINEAGLAVNGGIFLSVDDIFSCESSNITVTNGDFSAKAEVFVCDNCDIKIDNGMFSASDDDLYLTGECNVTINGGEFTADDYLIYGKDSEITINGGLFTSDNYSIANIYNCTLTVNDGSFKAYDIIVYSDGSEV